MKQKNGNEQQTGKLTDESGMKKTACPDPWATTLSRFHTDPSQNAQGGSYGGSQSCEAAVLVRQRTRSCFFLGFDPGVPPE